MDSDTQFPRTYALFHPKHKFRVGCWNVRSLNHTGAEELLISELERYKISICGLSEVRRPGQGTKTTGHWTILWSGGTDRTNGVGLALDRHSSLALTSHSCISDRLISARFKLPHCTLSVIQAYAPTECQSSDPATDSFYASLQQVVSAIPKRDCIILLGDFNAKVGNDNQIWSNVLGSHGIGKVNDNGHRLLSFSATMGFVHTNSFFQHKPSHKITWYSPTGRTGNAIDHILINRKFRTSVLDSRVYRGACALETDHRLVVATMRLKLMSYEEKMKLSNDRFAVELLKQPEIKDIFQLNIGGKFSSLLSLGDSEEEWKSLREGIVGTAKSVLGFSKKQKQKPWISDASMKVIIKKRVAYIHSADHPNDTIKRQVCQAA